MAELVMEQGGAVLAPEAAVVQRLTDLGRAVSRADLHRRHGRVMDLIGLIVEATGLEAEVGEVCEVRTGRDPPAAVGRRSVPKSSASAQAARC